MERSEMKHHVTTGKLYGSVSSQWETVKHECIIQLKPVEEMHLYQISIAKTTHEFTKVGQRLLCLAIDLQSTSNH